MRPLLWQGDKAVGSETLVTGRSITDMARDTDTNAKVRDIVRRNVTESALSVTNKLSGQGRKRKRTTSSKSGGKAKKAKKQPARGKTRKTKKKKKDIFS